MKCKFFIEKDSGEKEMAMQVILTSRISHVNISASKSSIRRFVITEKAPEITQGTVHSSSKATKNESSCPDEIPLQMLPMGIWGPENMKIENI